MESRYWIFSSFKYFNYHCQKTVLEFWKPFFLTQRVSKLKDLIKMSKVIFHIKLIPSHFWWECKKQSRHFFKTKKIFFDHRLRTFFCKNSYHHLSIGVFQKKISQSIAMHKFVWLKEIFVESETFRDVLECTIGTG